MNRAARIYRIHQLIRGGRRPVPLARIQQELEVSTATIKRDFQAMRDYLGAPLTYDADANGYYYSDREGPFELPGLWLNQSELFGLLAAEQVLELVQPGILRDRIGPLRGRIRALLGDAGQEAEDVAHRVQIDRVATRPVPSEAFTPVAEATLGRQQLAFTYHGRARNEERHRRVDPQVLSLYRGNWYLAAYCHDAEALRIFALDRIEAPAVLAEAAVNMDSKALDRDLHASFGIFTGTARQWAVLHFTPFAARWVADETWHPEQIGQWTPDGGWQIQIPYSDPTELIQEVLRHGPEVEVMAPADLRREVASRLRRAVDQYEEMSDDSTTQG